MNWFLIIFFSLYSCTCSAAEIMAIKIPRAGSTGLDSPSYYPEALLALALNKTEFIYGAFQVEYVNDMYSADRLRAMLVNRQGLDVMWSTVTREREQEMRSIDYDIFRGLSGYRRLIIRAADSAAFDTTRDLGDLRGYKIGVGAQWSDKLVYQHNQLPSVVGTRLDLLARMLIAKRFDYLARGLHEYEYDLASFAASELTVAENLLLQYCQPVNFFVNKNNPRLAERLSLGLTLAQADGSADTLFNSIPVLQRGRSALQTFNGRLITLVNPVCAGPSTAD